MSETPTIFTRIITGDLPSFKIYEDEMTFAFLDINPMQLGHTIVVPKIEVDHFYDVSKEYIEAVTASCQKISIAIKAATGCQRVASTILGFHVPHFHQHLIPLQNMQEYDRKLCSSKAEAEMKSIQQKIIENL